MMCIMSMPVPVSVAMTVHRIQHCLAHAIGHAKSDDAQSIPKSAHEHAMPHIPYPFETKRKHRRPPKPTLLPD